MSEKIPCTECGAAILPSTADRTGGLCMPCKNGNRKNIEQAKEYYKRERELDKTCPFRALWRELVDKVHKKEGGFAALQADEKLYYSVNTLCGEVYNGGFVQYFDNSSGEHYRYAELGLVRLGATFSLRNLRTSLFWSVWELLKAAYLLGPAFLGSKKSDLFGGSLGDTVQVPAELTR